MPKASSVLMRLAAKLARLHGGDDLQLLRSVSHAHGHFGG
jgi:hypothetical protein